MCGVRDECMVCFCMRAMAHLGAQTQPQTHTQYAKDKETIAIMMYSELAPVM